MFDETSENPGKLAKMAQLLDVNRTVASDRLSGVDRIYTLAVEVFGDSEKATQWLKRPSRALPNEWPVKLLATVGVQQVERELRQIQYGFV